MVGIEALPTVKRDQGAHAHLLTAPGIATGARLLTADTTISSEITRLSNPLNAAEMRYVVCDAAAGESVTAME